jgi:hypothetical protein
VTKHFSKIAVGICLIGAPLLTLVSTVVSPALKSDEAAQVAVIAAHPARYYAFALFTFAGIAMMIPAILGLTHLTRDRAPGWGNWGGSLALLGAIIAAGDAATQWLIWQMGAAGADQAQMAALLKRYDSAVGSSLPFSIGGLAILVGVVLLGIGLYRARAVPAWTAAGFVLGIVLNLVGFTAASLAILILSSLILLLALAPIGWRVLTESDDDWADARALALGGGRELASHPAG